MCETAGGGPSRPPEAASAGSARPGSSAASPGCTPRAPTTMTGRSAARALAAHLCRCTGWQPILDAWQAYPGFAAGTADAAIDPDPDQRAAADLRATIEGSTPQCTGSQVSFGAGGFADDTAPAGRPRSRASWCGFASAADEHGWVVADTAAEARRLAGQIPGRRTTASWEPPLEVPPGDWAVTLRTSWIEPGYLETDAAWCAARRRSRPRRSAMAARSEGSSTRRWPRPPAAWLTGTAGR